MKNFTIRKAIKKDFKEIANILVKESSKKPYDDNYNSKMAFKKISELSKQELYAATKGKEIIGFIASNITLDNKKKAYIEELWLKPSYQRKGIGKSLVKFVEDIYKKRGVKIIRLVTKRNAGAFKFYKKINYQEYKELVFMEKRLKIK